MDRSTMDRTANVSWTDILSALHQSVRKAVLDAGREAIGTRNAKGDDVKCFDLVANDAALAVFREIQLPIVVNSEESEPLETGSSVPSMTKDSRALDDVRVSGYENTGMHMAVSRGSEATGTAGRGPEHVAEGGLALADRASVGGGTRHL